MTISRIAAILSMTLSLTVAANVAFAQGDAAAGEKLFKKKCASCHFFDSSGKKRVGPNLYGVVGRQAGTSPHFPYSNDLKEAGFAWNPQRLDMFLTKPKAMFKRTRMTFVGLRKPSDRADVIAYLSTAK
ncbi:c-type cytochrome [Magnetofaba australis]|uniref:Putative cytochrome c family protein n=1 Tax=Magnetofaba australis IT-1 TaxID=1434232 RepID=A0A1Y2K9I5_9PROT|nr:cytochrome c family protein [Magnetofaba australis]OSM07146.1 putative cytochrome c family protein [Magnetofaba australis IT-1]